MELTAYTVFYVGAALIALVVAAFIWERRQAPGAVWLMLIMLAGAQWAFCDAMDMSATTLEGHIFWAKCSYLGATPTSAFLLLFALEFSGHSRYVNRRLIGALMAVPIVSTVATFFNEYHQLTWTGFTPAPQDPRIIVYGHGPLYWLTTVILTSYLFMATVILFRFALRNRNVFAWQSTLIISAGLIPWAALMIYNFMPWLWPGLNPSIAIVATGGLFTVSMFSFRLLDLTPVARSALFEVMGTGVLVADAQGRVLDINPAARRLLQTTGPVGSEMGELLGSRWAAAAEGLAVCPSAPIEFTSLGGGGKAVSFTVTPLHDTKGACRGTVITVDDITQRIEAHRALREANEALTDRIAEVERLHADLSERAVRDPLTGLYNRRYLDETLGRELGRSQREGRDVSVIMLDIDHFKAINDTQGHHVGDTVLCLLASELEQLTRASDIACRYGGDEFLLVMADTPAAIALRRAEELRESFTVAGSALVGGRPVTVSVGVATFPHDGHEPTDLIAAADHAVYDAKAAGRDRVRQAHRRQSVGL